MTFEGRPFEPNGHIDVTPDIETTYTLIAKGAGGERTEHVTVKVHAKPVAVVVKPIIVDEKPAIMAALDRWKSAYESLDQARLRAAYTGIPSNVAEGIQKLAKQNAKVNVSYSGCTEPKVTGDSAGMQCTETVAVIVSGEKPPPRPRKVALQFAKHGDKWLLSSLSSSN